jgi:antitoxin CptB
MDVPGEFAGMIDREEMNRMRWAARRGMLELDLLLEPFVASRYALLCEADRRSFQRLMHCEDQDLYAWLMQRQPPGDEEFTRIVSQILIFAHTADSHR